MQITTVISIASRESPSLRHITKQVIEIPYKTNKTEDLKVISDVRCVRTGRLGSPNTALLPYKMGGTLQRTFADCGMGIALAQRI